MSGFFEELQRRKVYRIAAAYIIAAGFIIQIRFGGFFRRGKLPNWTLRLVVVLLLMGFPIALILPGLRRTLREFASPRITRRRNLIMLIATGVIISAGAGFFSCPGVSAQDRKVDCCPAVQSLSDEKETPTSPMASGPIS